MWLRYALTVGVAVCFISSRCLAQTGEDIIGQSCANHKRIIKSDDFVGTVRRFGVEIELF